MLTTFCYTGRMAICTVKGCDRNDGRKRFCTNHREKWIKYGDPLGGRGPKGESLAKRVARRDPIMQGGCHLWPGQHNSYGYGYLHQTVDKKRTYYAVHRIVFEGQHGPIPLGMEIDHTCHNEAAAKGDCAGGDSCLHRRCYNVEHLRLATPSQNTRASAIKMNRDRDRLGRFA